MGKKTKAWLKAKPKLVKIYLNNKIIRCENCGSKWALSFHHRPSRASQEAKHDLKHTRLLCPKCHPHFEYNEEADKKLFAKSRGYQPENEIEIMAKKESKKPDWQKSHKCVHCKQICSHYICPNCGKASVK